MQTHLAAASLPPTGPLLLRDATAADFDAILSLNAESVHFLSPLSAERLQALHAEAAYHRVVDVDGRAVAFLLALREGCRYDSVNYRWFADRFDRFLYIDRITVSRAHQGQGLGPRLYQDLFAFARRSDATRVTCEFDIEPPNPVSQRFHARMGFEEVGSQWLAWTQKRVSMQAALLA